MKKIGEKNKQKISFPNKRNGKSSVSYGSHSSEDFPSSSIQGKTNIFYTLKTLLSQESRTLVRELEQLKFVVDSLFTKGKIYSAFSLFFLYSPSCFFQGISFPSAIQQIAAKERRGMNCSIARNTSKQWKCLA